VFLFLISLWKAATQVDNAVLPAPPVQNEVTAEAAEIAMKVEETLDVIGAEVGDAIVPFERADV
jgi:hypothetical protein